MTEPRRLMPKHGGYRLLRSFRAVRAVYDATVVSCDRFIDRRSRTHARAEDVDHPRAKELFDRHKLPTFHDPFAGGWSLSLEAQRPGLEAYSSDLTPVAVLINKAMIEIPPNFAGQPPVNPESQARDLSLGPKDVFLGPVFLGPRASRPQDPPEPHPSRPHKHWHSRGYLPHLDEAGLVQSITFRLHDSVPHRVIESWRSELGGLANTGADDPRAIELRKRVEKYEDAGHGECLLAREDIARVVEDALLHFDGERYRLVAGCVMPTHVDALIETIPGHPLGEVVHSWKSFTAKEANKALGRSGEFWTPDYYDRFVRDERHPAAEVRYIEHNPVKAGLVARAEEWRFSSAAGRAAGTAALPG